MGRMERSKGARVEREIVSLHQDAGIHAEKVSRSGYVGEDLQIIGDLRVEVKARRNGNGFSTLEEWLGDCDVLFLRRNNAKPMVYLPWTTWLRLVKALAKDKAPFKDESFPKDE